jgi:hypothetical protein
MDGGTSARGYTNMSGHCNMDSTCLGQSINCYYHQHLAVHWSSSHESSQMGVGVGMLK